MKILALDSSGLVAAVAVAEDEILTAEYTVNYKKTHSQTLIPMLQAIRDMVELDLSTIDAIAIAAGPGSFTGLRIGSATAKGLGLALSRPLVEVPTVAGLAYNLWGTEKLICPVMDARRNQVYTGIYTFERMAGENGSSTYSMQTLKEQCAADICEIAEELNKLGESLSKDVIFLGDGVPVYKDILSAKLKVPYSFAPAHLNRQRASSVAALAQLYYKEGKIVSAGEHQPDYLRLSQAERERMEQEQREKEQEKQVQETDNGKGI